MHLCRSSDVRESFSQHAKGHAAEWTKLYKPIKIVKVIPGVDEFDEDSHVLRCMKAHGIDNVRGGTYSNVILSKEQLSYIDKQMNKARIQLNNFFLVCCDERK
jgi:hypothetical protein